MMTFELEAESSEEESLWLTGAETGWGGGGWGQSVKGFGHQAKEFGLDSVGGCQPLKALEQRRDADVVRALRRKTETGG